MHEEYSATSMDCKETAASVLELRNRRLFEPQKLQKRVSFKDEAWVIHIPAREESDMDLRESVILTRNAVAGRSALTNRAVTPNRRTSLEMVSRNTLHANRDQRNGQTQSFRMASSGHVASRGPYKSILKTTPNRQKEDHLNRSQMPARYLREVSARNSVDSYFKQDSSHLLPSKDTLNRLEKRALARTLPARRSLTISRALSSDDDLGGWNKTGRFVGREFSGSSRTSVEHNFNHNEHTKTVNTATRPEGNFNIVGVTYRSVNEMPYFYDIKGLTNKMNEYSSGAKSPLNDRASLEHSSVSASLNQSGSRREERYLSAVPAIEAFHRRNRGARRHFSSAWTREQDTSPKRQLPIAWQPAKQYNFSTK